MYLTRISIRNVRSITNLDLEFPADKYAGWHVLLGDNGAGKSTVVRSIALALAGPTEAAALRQNWDDWLQAGCDEGSIDIHIKGHASLDKAVKKGKQRKYDDIPARLELKRFPHRPSGSLVTLTPNSEKSADRYLWGEGRGWFSASYGPFRRFTGGDRTLSKLFYSNPRLAPHLSVFGEDIALTESLEWLQALHVKGLEGSSSDQQVLDDLKSFLNEGELLPHNTRLESVSSKGVVFRDGHQRLVPVTMMSDGYRSILSMTFELIRQMVLVYDADKVFANIRKHEMVVNLPGVVLVDEIDVHLHPTWQRAIGGWFLKYFPKVQFIVTTHSPLVCQAAEHGSVWRLPTPGTEGVVEQVTGTELNKILYGDLVEAYDTKLFGIASTRSDAGKQKQTRLAELNVKSRHEKLTATESAEQQMLRAAMPTAAVMTTVEP